MRVLVSATNNEDGSVTVRTYRVVDHVDAAGVSSRELILVDLQVIPPTLKAA